MVFRTMEEKGCRKIIHLMVPNKKCELYFLSNVNISSRSRLTQNWLDFLSHLGVQSNDPIVFKCEPHCNHNLHGIYPIKSYCLDSIRITPSDSPERSFSASFPFWNLTHQFIWKYFSSWNNGKCLWNSFEHSVIVTYLDLTSTSELGGNNSVGIELFPRCSERSSASQFCMDWALLNHWSITGL